MTAALGDTPTPPSCGRVKRSETHQTNAMKAIPLFVTLSRRRRVYACMGETTWAIDRSLVGGAEASVDSSLRSE